MTPSEKRAAALALYRDFIAQGDNPPASTAGLNGVGVRAQRARILATLAIGDPETAKIVNVLKLGGLLEE